MYKGDYKRASCDDEPTLVAIKMIKNETFDIKDAKEFLYDFDREIRILSKLDHRNIIKFLGVVRLDPTKIVFSMVSLYSMVTKFLLTNCLQSVNYKPIFYLVICCFLKRNLFKLIKKNNYLRLRVLTGNALYYRVYIGYFLRP